MWSKLALAALTVCPLLGAEDWKTSVPIIYNIDYGAGHVGSPEYLKKIADAPPQLMHVGEDVPISSVYGTKDGYSGNKPRLLSAAEVRAKIKELEEYTAGLHRAGVDWVIPYINNKAVIGDHVKRSGFFEFFDRWDRFAEFGFGPRPSEDMAQAQMRYPFRRMDYAKKEHPFYPNRLYQMCGNNPNWRRYLLAVTANIARCGYDGVFVDEMDLRDYCAHDETKFRAYLAQKYTEVERRRRFGRADLESLALGYPGDGALWYDTQAFWSYSNADLLRAVRDEGRKTNPNFFVIPNYGPFAHFDGVSKRAPSGKDPAPWAPVSRLIMFEEMQRPGQLAENIFLDYILQYKLAFAYGFRAGLLSYMAREPVGIELSMAEAAAGGGGALIQPYYEAPESRRKFRRFFAEHRELFEGYESCADVAVLFAYDQLYWGNASHVQALYRLSQYLSEQHIPFDLIAPAQATSARLSRYAAVITPYLRYVPDSLLAELRRYAAAGGVWLDIGGSGQFDDAGHLRMRMDREPAVERLGKGRILRTRDLNELLPYPRFALYLMKEDDANELKEIVTFLQAAQAGEIITPPGPHGPDLRAVLEANTRPSLSILPAASLAGLRSNLWRNKNRVVAHFVNYYCPIPTQVEMGKGQFKTEGSPEQFAPKVLEKVAVRLRVPAGKVTSVRAFDPDSAQPVSLPYTQKGNSVEFILPAVRIYKLVELTL
jgi:hypothetical protein